VTIEGGKGKHRKYLPYVFTEQGVSMLSAVLRSDIAIQVSIQIIQAFDAHVFASDLVKQAQKSILLVDNYVDENTLLLLSKRKKGVTCIVHTRLNAILKKDIEKHNKQYPKIDLIENKNSHDRFLILDDSMLYHIGASLKDLGNKCFAFSRMDNLLDEVQTKLLKY
jgi:hypothetical protein